MVSELLNSNKENIKDFCNSVILMSFIIFNKITLLMCLLLGLIALKKINLYEVFKLKRFYFLIIFIVFWFLKNIIISGCVIYPVKSLCFKSLIWSDLQAVESLSITNEAWTNILEMSRHISGHRGRISNIYRETYKYKKYCT